MTEYTDDTQTITVALKAASGVIGVNCANSCDLLNRYDTNNDGVIDAVEVSNVAKAAARGDISNVESKFINDAYIAQSINGLCPGCYTGTGSGGTPTPAPAPPPAPPASEGDPTVVSHQYNLEAGEYDITVTKNNYETVTSRIKVLSNGEVDCEDVTGVYGCGTGYPRVETVGASVRVYMAYAGGHGGGPVPIASDVCSWIIALGGWRSITWDDVLAMYDAFLDPDNFDVGFPVVWDDVMTVYDYFLDQESGSPTAGNASAHGCNFT